ncbi:MAG: aldo/keto reductase [Rhodobacter sp.]|nr:aldo/keto reductase [Rhodobacter sp.]
MADKKFPVIGTMRLGSWGANLAPGEVARFLSACVELGCVDIDLADIYGDHTVNTLVGRALAEAPELKTACRLIAKVGIARKCDAFPGRKINYYDSSAHALKSAIDASFEELGVDQVEMLMIHRFDYLTDAAAVAEAITPYLKNDQAARFGVSNYAPLELDLLRDVLPVTANQIQLSLSHIDPVLDGSMAAFQARNCEVMAWSPLGGGAAFDADNEVGARVAPVADEIAARHGATRSQVYFAWINAFAIARPVLGTAQIDRVKEAVDAIDLRLDHEEWYRLLEAGRGRGVD